MKKIVVIIIGIILIILIFVTLLFLEKLKTKPKQNPTNPTPPTASRITEKTATSVRYNADKSRTLLKTLLERPTPTTQTDAAIREQLVASLSGNSGTLSETTTYKLDYVKAPNDFEAEIKTANASSAKQEVVSYLLLKGLTNDGICKLPLVFFLDFQVLNSYRLSGKTFSPIPDFCK